MSARNKKLSDFLPPVNPAETAEGHFHQFMLQVFPKGTTYKVRQEIRDVFFAGATVTHWQIMQFLERMDVNSVVAVQMVERLGRELSANIARTKKRSAIAKRSEASKKLAKKIIRDVAKAKVKR